MKTAQDTRINDIINSGLGIDISEIKGARNAINGTFVCSSIEYHTIIHLTNEEYYYLDDETINNYIDSADEVVDTDSYLIIAFK